MLSKLYARKNRDDGFTLIELLVVVIIIGVLAAIALPIFIDQTKSAVDASVKSDVRNTVTNVNNWRAQHDTALPESAEAYATAGGKLATSRGAYVNVAFTSDNDYVVCGYNPGGAKYADYKHAWAFTASTGQFTNLADISGECTDAVHVRPALDDTSGDNAGAAAGGGRIVMTTPTDSADSSAYLAYDPNGKRGTPAAGGGNPGGGTGNPGGGGSNPTTGDPGTSATFAGLNVNRSNNYGAAQFSTGNGNRINADNSHDDFYYGNPGYIDAGSADAVLKASTSPFIDGLKAGDARNTAMTNVKFYTANGSLKSFHTGSSGCNLTANMISQDGDDDYYSVSVSCARDGIVFPDDNVCNSDKTYDANGTVRDEVYTDFCYDYKSAGDKLAGGYLTFTDKDDASNRLNLTQDFYYFYDN